MCFIRKVYTNTQGICCGFQEQENRQKNEISRIKNKINTNPLSTIGYIKMK